MRKLVWSTMMSLDGQAARAAPAEGWSQLDWHVMDEDLATDVAALLSGSGALLMGRVTYEGFAGFWAAGGGPGSDAAERLIAPHMARLPKVVLSTTLEDLPWGPASVVRGDLAREIGALKRQPGKDLLFLAGPTAAASLLDLDLVDELHIHLHPVALGRGKPLFKDLAHEQRLRLVDAKPRKSGVVSLRYARAEEGHP